MATPLAKAAKGLLPPAAVGLEEILRGISDSFVTLDLEWRFTYVNRRALESMGKPREAFLGHHYSELFPGPGGLRFLKKLQRCARRGEPVFFDYYYAPKGIWFEHRIFPNQAGISIFSSDISRRKRAELALAQASLELEDRVRARTAELERLNSVLNEEIRARARAERRLRGLMGRVQSLREEERARMSREIHDVLGQSLTALKLELGAVVRRLERRSGKPVKAMVVDSMKIVDDVMSMVQRIAAELRPGLLDDIGLDAAVAQEAAGFERRSGVRCTVDANPGLARLSPKTATACFRIVQELLTNIARHAKAREARISLGLERSWLVLRVADDGTGISRQAWDDPRSLGLLGLRERAKLLGGEAILEKTKGGAAVLVRVPRRKRRP